MGQSVHRFVHHQIQFEPDALYHRQPVQPIANQAGNVRLFSCTAKHPYRSIHRTLQTIKSVVRRSSEKAVTVVNPADYKAVDKRLRRIKWKRLDRALDPSRLLEASADDMIDV